VIVREYFPPREAATRVGNVLSAMLIGMALGGWASGAIFDLTGSYRAAFLHGLVWNAINIFIVKVTTGQAQFIATSRFSPPSWPLGASADFVVWTEGYCGAAQGKTRVYDRRGGIVTELDQSLWVTMTPGGLIGAGEFGPAALIDPRSLQYVAVLPSKAGQTGPAVDVSWSPDFKYASRGQAFGHGGYCGG